MQALLAAAGARVRGTLTHCRREFDILAHALLERETSDRSAIDILLAPRAA